MTGVVHLHLRHPEEPALAGVSKDAGMIQRHSSGVRSFVR